MVSCVDCESALMLLLVAVFSAFCSAAAKIGPPFFAHASTVSFFAPPSSFVMCALVQHIIPTQVFAIDEKIHTVGGQW